MNKVIFLVGGPGSGKDILLKNVLSDLREYKINQIYKTHLDKSFVVSATACDYDDITEAKQFLERKGYDTAMIFVHVTEEISKSRYIPRSENSETIRSYKYNNSVKNLYEFYSLFDDFLRFDNNLIIENRSQFKEVEQFCDDFFFRGYLSEKKVVKRKAKIEKSSDIITADNIMQGNMDRIQPSPDYGMKWESHVPFSYTGIVDMPLIAGISRISSGEPESYREKDINDMISKNVMNKIKKVARKSNGKKSNT